MHAKSYWQVFICFTIFLQVSATQNIECPSEGLAYLPHPDCTLYIICVNGVGTEAECPRPLYYNPTLQQCDFPENVPECIGGTRPPTNGSTTTTQKPTEEPTIPTTPLPPNTLTECGQTITDSWGTIQYKLGERYKANELCTFIIRIQNYNSARFTLESHGISENDTNSIIILPFYDTVLLDAVYFGPPDSETTREVQGFIFVVVFNPQTNLGTGFKLTFEATGNTGYNYYGQDFIFNNDTASPFQVGDWEEYPGLSKFNVIVLTADAKEVTEPDSVLKLRLSENFSTELGCFDKFYIHIFQNRIAEDEIIFCDEDYNQITYETMGLFIVGFFKFYDTPNVTGTLAWGINDVKKHIFHL